jgi:hypothetical protein
LLGIHDHPFPCWRHREIGLMPEAKRLVQKWINRLPTGEMKRRIAGITTICRSFWMVRPNTPARKLIICEGALQGAGRGHRPFH